MSLLDRFKKEPAVVVGIIAAAILATVQSLGGNGVLDGSAVDWITNALDPAGLADPARHQHRHSPVRVQPRQDAGDRERLDLSARWYSGGHRAKPPEGIPEN